jgi:hypothetical protein
LNSSTGRTMRLNATLSMPASGLGAAARDATTRGNPARAPAGRSIVSTRELQALQFGQRP